MAVAISIADVLAQVAFRLHLPDFASGEFVTDTQALQLAKMSVSRLGAMLNRSFGDNYFSQAATLTTTEDVDLISLPASFKDLLSLHWVQGNDTLLLVRADITEYDAVSRAWSRAVPPKYRLDGNTLLLTPTPNQAYTLRIAYTTGLSISTTADTIQALPGCDEWLVLDMCEIIRGDRENKDASRFTARKMQIEEDLKAQARARDRHGVTSVRDVRGELDNEDSVFWRDRLGLFGGY